jgi:hypothetical protein
MEMPLLPLKLENRLLRPCLNRSHTGCRCCLSGWIGTSRQGDFSTPRRLRVRLSRRWSLHPCQSLSRLPPLLISSPPNSRLLLLRNQILYQSRSVKCLLLLPQRSLLLPKLSAPASPLSRIMNLPRALLPHLRPNPRAPLPNPSLR